MTRQGRRDADEASAGPPGRATLCRCQASSLVSTGCPVQSPPRLFVAHAPDLAAVRAKKDGGPLVLCLKSAPCACDAFSVTTVPSARMPSGARIAPASGTCPPDSPAADSRRGRAQTGRARRRELLCSALQADVAAARACSPRGRGEPLAGVSSGQPLALRVLSGVQNIAGAAGSPHF